MSASIKLLFVIAERGNGNKIADFLTAQGVTMHNILMGKGTADSKWLSLLGLGDEQKDVVVSPIVAEKVKDTLNLLKEEFGFDKPGTGLAFTIKLTSVAGLDTLHAIIGKEV